jgi:hypothetical protein
MISQPGTPTSSRCRNKSAGSHSDAVVDAPHCELLFQRLPPGQDVLVDAVHQRAVKVEQEGRASNASHMMTTTQRAPAAAISETITSLGCGGGRRRFPISVTAGDWIDLRLTSFPFLPIPCRDSNPCLSRARAFASKFGRFHAV